MPSPALNAPLPHAVAPQFQAIVDRLLGSLLDSGLITDTTPGGVARTLVETFAREMALFYELLQRAHAAGYLDSAEGEALDQVVALLGITRARAGRLAGRVMFSRQTAAPQDIAIPAGFRVSGRSAGPKQPSPLLEVVETATLQRGQRSVLVLTQEIPGEETPGIKSIAPRSLGIMPRPLLGVEAVTNPEAITRSGVDEDDASLRARARVALRAGERATAEAIEAAVRAQGVTQVRLSEPKDGPPGRVTVQVCDVAVAQDAERWASLEAAVYQAKAAGVRVELQRMKAVLVLPHMDITPERSDLDPSEEETLRGTLRDTILQAINTLPPGAPVLRRKLEGVALAVPGVQDARLTESTQTMPMQISPDGVSPGAADTSSRRLPDGSGWSMGEMEQAVLELDRWPRSAVTIRRGTS